MAKYSREFKLEAVRMSQQEGVTAKSVAKDLGIRPDTLYRWRSEMRKNGDVAFPGKGNMTPQEQQIYELERKAARLEQERDVLKKALEIFSTTRPT